MSRGGEQYPNAHPCTQARLINSLRLARTQVVSLRRTAACGRLRSGKRQFRAPANTGGAARGDLPAGKIGDDLRARWYPALGARIRAAIDAVYRAADGLDRQQRPIGA